MAAYVAFNASSEHLAEKVHDLGADTIRVYLTNATPDVVADVGKADLAEIATGNGYSGPITLTNKTSAQTSGNYMLDADNIVILAVGGAIAQFRYAVLYNDTPTTPVADPLLGYWDFGAAVDLAAGESRTIVFGVTGILRLNKPV